jgi:predicted transglutaminase-like cysteine proteinase
MMRYLAHVAIAVLVAALTVTPGTLAARTALFGTKEVRSNDLTPFTKWTGALERYFDERTLREAPCDRTEFNRCHLRQWKDFLGLLQGKSRMVQLAAVNRYMNDKTYVIDPVNWGMKDYWATPFQFFDKEGNCEDYAIAKFMSLRALGFDNDDMRIVVLQDLNLRVPHAILMVFVGKWTLVLDNQFKQVVPQAIIRHYKPIYSLNEKNWWLHR